MKRYCRKMIKRNLFVKSLVSLTCISMLFTGCGNKETDTKNQNDTTEEIQQAETQPFEMDLTGASTILLSDKEIMVNGEKISQNETDAVYSANDIVFYLEGQDFTYGEGTEEDEHSQEEADAHTVVHITQPGTYMVSGELSAGQIAIDLGEEAEKNPEAVVNLVLNGVDITCEVAPAVIFYNVYECGSKEEEDAAKEVDTSAAGANVWIADGTENNIVGSYVARIYKSVELNEDGTEVVDSKKLHKYDAAFYSKMSMNVDGGTGVLNIDAENEGLDSELHLTINGGNINITSGNDGINTNEDNISVTTVNGGALNIVVDGTTGEGDGIDSNGWLVINGGSVTASACSISGDAGIDSDKGIYLNGGNVVAGGNMLDQIAGSEQNYAVFTFSERVTGGTTITMKAEDDGVVGEWELTNDYTYLIVSGTGLKEGTYTLWKDNVQLATGGSMRGIGGRGGMGGQMMNEQAPEGMEKPQGGELPEGFDPSQMELPEGMEKPERGEIPEGFDQSQKELPEGMEKPEGGQRPDGVGQPSGEATTEFIIVQGVNYFSCQEVAK